MYDDIDEKIKAVALIGGLGGAVICGLIGLIAALITGNVLLLLFGVIAALLFIIASWPMYGFGELIHNSQQQNQLILKQNQLLQNLIDNKFQNKESNSVTDSIQNPSAENSNKDVTPFYNEAIEKKAYCICGNCGYEGKYEGNCPKCQSSIRRYIYPNKE